LWQEWFGFEGEQPYSQNFIVGAPPDLRQLVKPLPVVGGWFFLSLAMLYGLARFRRTQPLPPAVLLVFVACWFSIDSRWQLDLLTQNRLTAARYAGLNDAEKHAAGAHPELVSFAREIHAALPAGMQTIHIFAQRKPEQRFSKLRLNWLLLPHQISYSRIKPAPLYPPRPGEFVVVLRDHQFLQVDTDAGLLRWPAGTPAKPESKSLRVTVLLDHPSGFLLRVEP
jgi:hypothetical protein